METIDLLRSGQLQGIKRLNLAAGLTEFPIESQEGGHRPPSRFQLQSIL